MIILIVLVLLIVIYIGNAPTRNDQRLGREAYDRQQDNFHERNKELAKQYDCYYEQNKLPTMDINVNYYGDGSLRKDSKTGRTYDKGRYFVNSYGQMANGKYDPTKERPG